MNPKENEIEELVRQAIALGEENNAILKKMQRSARISSVLRVCYWILIIGLSFGAYYFVQPYVTSLGSLLSSLTGSNSTNNSTNNMSPQEQNAVDNAESVLKKL